MKKILLTLCLLFAPSAIVADSHCEKKCHNDKCTCDSSCGSGCDKKEGGECTCENCECECCSHKKSDSEE